MKVTSITNGFKKAGITNVLGGSKDGESDASSDDEQMETSATLDPVGDAHLIDLFNSDTEDEDFDDSLTFYGTVLTDCYSHISRITIF